MVQYYEIKWYGWQVRVNKMRFVIKFFLRRFFYWWWFVFRKNVNLWCGLMRGGFLWKLKIIYHIEIWKTLKYEKIKLKILLNIIIINKFDH